MKKMTALLITCFLFFTGCGGKKKENPGVSKAKIEAYETYYQAVLDNPVFAGSSENYDISFEMNKIPDGSYRYYVIVDQPRTSMYDIVMIAVEDDIPYNKAKKMMPSSGIFENPVSMIPGQVNKKDGFAKGVVMSGETKKDSVNLKILVEWSNKDNTEKKREFLSFRLDENGAEHQKQEKE